MHGKTSKAVVVALLGGSMALAACSSTGTSSPGKETAPAKPSSSSASSAAAAEPSSSTGTIGGDIVAPVTVRPDEREVSVPVGSTLYFSLDSGGWGEPGDFSVIEGTKIKALEDVNNWTIVSDLSEVLSVAPGSDNGTEATAPTAQALVPGQAQVRLINAKAEYLWVLDVNVEPSGDTVNALPEDQLAKARVGDVVEWQDFPSEEAFGQVTVTSDNESVLAVLPQSFVVLLNVKSAVGYVPAAARLWAKAEGTATVTIENPVDRTKRDLTVFVAPQEPTP